jgi:hypothetical protein
MSEACFFLNGAFMFVWDPDLGNQHSCMEKSWPTNTIIKEKIDRCDT